MSDEVWRVRDIRAHEVDRVHPLYCPTPGRAIIPAEPDDVSHGRWVQRGPATDHGVCALAKLGDDFAAGLAPCAGDEDGSAHAARPPSMVG